MYKNSTNESGIKNFRILLINSTISRFGFSSFDLLVIWVVLYLTHSPFLSGLADGSLSFPLFISFIVGAYVDRVSRKKIMAVSASFLRSGSMIFIFTSIMLRNDFLILISIYFSAFVIGFTSDLLNSIRASWTKEFLDSEHYKSGTSIQSSLYSIAEGLGYVSSGILISWGMMDAFLGLFLIFTVSVIPIFFMGGLKKIEIVDSGISNTLREGILFIKSHRIIMEIIIISLLANFVFGMAGIIFIVLVQLHFRLPSVFVSTIFGLLMVGIIVGSLFANKLRGKVGFISSINLFVIGISLFSIYFINDIFLVLIPSTVIGISIGIINVAIGTAILKIIPQNMMARIQGAFSTFSVAIVSLSGMIGGIIVQITGYEGSFLLLGFIVIIMSPLSLLFRGMMSLRI
ncbi:MAG: MFS transporter [Thermoplasmata archaeon]